MRLKAREFKFSPVKGWLGRNLVEKVEGWQCQVYEAAGKMATISISKAKLELPEGATFDDYLNTHYEGMHGDACYWNHNDMTYTSPFTWNLVW